MHARTHAHRQLCVRRVRLRICRWIAGPLNTSTRAHLCVLISCVVQKATSSHLALLLTATGNYQCFILTGFDVLKQGCSRTTVSKAQHWASSNSSVSSELSVLHQLSDLFIWLELVPKKSTTLLSLFLCLLLALSLSLALSGRKQQI